MKKITKRLIFGILIFLVIFSVFIYWNIGNKKSSLKNIKFGYQPFGSNLPFFVAIDKGFFEKRGINIVPVKILSANDAASAIINGDIVGDATIPLNVLLSIEEQQPDLMKIFMVKATSKEVWSDYLLVKKDSTIKFIKNLKGKKVGAYPGSAQQSLLKVILEKFIEDEDYTLIELPPATQLQALDSGQIDALLTYDQIAITAIEKGIAQVLEENPLKYVVDPLYGFPYVLSSNFIEKNPENAEKIRDAFYEAADFIKYNEDEARYIMAKWIGAELNSVQKVNLWDQIKAEEINKDILQKLADIFYEEGVIKKKIYTKDFYLTENDLR